MIQVYTGSGKGKTSAALGLALRAAGAGQKVYIAQFIKGGGSSEFKSLKKLKNVKTQALGKGCFIKGKPKKEDLKLCKKGINKIKKILLSGEYDIVILDEINIALHYKLIGLDDLLCLIKLLPRSTELILTGRHAHPEILNIADLVSEIREVKHYYRKGIKARKGIEY